MANKLIQLSDGVDNAFINTTIDKDVALPFEASIQQAIDELPSGRKIWNIMVGTSSSYYAVIVQKYSNNAYASAIAFSYDGRASFFAKAGGVWQPTKSLV